MNDSPENKDQKNVPESVYYTIDATTTDNDFRYDSDNISEEEVEEPTPKFRLIRTVMYGACIFMVGFIANPLAPVSKPALRVFHTNLVQINLASSLFPIGGIVSGFVSNYLIQKVGIRYSVLLATFFYTAGTSMRLLLERSFVFLFIGQFIEGLGSSLVQNGISNFVNHWYDSKSVRSLTGFFEGILRLKYI